jgi:hypothetical protein
MVGILEIKKRLPAATTTDFGNRLNRKWFCIWDDLLRLLAITRVANPKNGLI